MGRRADVLRRLDEEWAALQHDAGAQAACRRWARAARVLAGCCEPGHVLARVPDAADAVLGHLLREVAAGDALAGRVVVQAMLPKVVLMASVDPGAGVDHYLTALWCEVATYPLARRPRSIAANLALDTLKSVQRERRPALDVMVPPHLVQVAADRSPARVVGSARPDPTPGAVIVLARADGARLVDPATSALLRSVYGEGLSGAAAARRHGMTPGAVRVRCSRAVKVLAGHAELLLEPA